MFSFYLTDSWNDFTKAAPCPWNVVEFVMTHQEGHVAKASLMVGNFTPPAGAYLGIFEDDTLLFQGMISGQFEHHQHLTKVDVLTLAPTFEEDVKALLAGTSLPYNKDFFQGKIHCPSDYLEAGNALFYWNRVTGKIGLSDYFKGKRCVDVSGQYLERSFKMQQIAMPLGSVVVDLRVHWTQHLGGTFNASPYIARGFPEKMIATLTPEAITAHWPREDQRLGLGRRQSGYRVENAKIVPLQMKGLKSHTAPMDGMVSDEKRSLQAKIHYFKAALNIQWQYNQPRVEEMKIEGWLNHCQHKLTKHRVRRISITIALPKSEQAMFFDTQKGREFTQYASALATSQLKASARCIQVMCTLPWKLGRDLTVDDSLKAEGKFAGKVTRVRHVVKGMQRFVEVTVGCMIEAGDLVENAVTAADCEYGEEAFDEEVKSRDKLRGIAHPMLNPKDLIARIEVKNSASAQEGHLLRNQYPLRDNMAAVLQEVPTSIHLTMRDLRTNKPLVRRFEKRLPLVGAVGR